MLPRLLVAVTAVAVAGLPAQAFIQVPTQANGGHCNAIPFGNFTDVPFSTNQKYQTLVPWSQLSQLTQPVIVELGFLPCYDGIHRFTSIKIRMATTSSPALTRDFAKNLGASPVTVLESKDYYWHHQKDKWSRIGLQRPFQLVAGRHLVVDIEVTGAIFVMPDFTSSKDDVGGFRTAPTQPRLTALDWKTAPPPVGDHGSHGLCMELSSNLSALGVFGIGCMGKGTRRPRLELSGNAAPSGTINVQLSQALANNPTLLVIGFKSSPPYPLSLGFPECRLYQSLDLALAATTTASGELTIPIPLPATAALSNQRFYTQFFQIEMSSSLGLRGSNYGRVLVR